MSNVITAYFYKDNLFFRTQPVFQYNEGDQMLVFSGITLPNSYRVDFSNYEDSHDSVPMIGDSNGVVIPDSLLATGMNVYAFYVDVDQDTVTTMYRAEIPVIKRPEPTDIEPTPEEQSLLDQIMAQLAAAIEAVEQAGLSAVGASEDYVPTADGDGGWEWAAQQGGGGGGTTELFEATYGTTTNAQIEAALDANKLVYCVYENRVYLLTSRQSATQHRFTTITHIFILHALVCNNNSWSKVSLTPQSTSNLVTSVSSASTDSEYPSAKLFYDTIGDVESLLAAI